jgi:Serine aminopeptidase, S33
VKYRGQSLRQGAQRLADYTRTSGSAATPMAEGGALVRPPTDETGEEYAEGFLAGAAGAEIYWRAWLPSGATRAVVIIAHGIGEHSGRYAHVAGQFTVASFTTYVLDHRGHGQSSGPRALIDRMDHAGDAVEQAAVLLRRGSLLDGDSAQPVPASSRLSGRMPASPSPTSTQRSRNISCCCCAGSGSSILTVPCPPMSGTSVTSNPPVQAWAALEVFAIDGGRDFDFLSRIFDKLLVNFAWWVNREDSTGSNLFEGGFLGLDNIGPLDRSHLPVGGTLEQSDATGWMASYALAMTTIAAILHHSGHRPTLDLVQKSPPAAATCR